MTPLDLITQALKKTGVVGVGQTPLAEDVNDAFLDLNLMLGQWNRKRWLIYHLTEVAFPATGATSYRIGPGMAVDVPARVTKIDSAFYRINPTPDLSPDFSFGFSSDFGPPDQIGSTGIDVPLEVVRSREDYSRIALKGMGGFPSAVYLDANYPFGQLTVWPVPSTGEIHVVVQDVLNAFPDLTTDIELPNEYHEALLYNLTARLRPSYGKPPEPTITAIARASLNTIRVANAQISTLQMPRALVAGRGQSSANLVFAAASTTPATPPVPEQPVPPIIVDLPDTIKPISGDF
jgi:hypothetical protein